MSLFLKKRLLLDPLKRLNYWFLEPNSSSESSSDEEEIYPPLQLKENLNHESSNLKVFQKGSIHKDDKRNLENKKVQMIHEPTSLGTSESSDDQESEPDGANDKCDLTDCKIERLITPHLNWVQCEDCDRWYHTFCVCGSASPYPENKEYHCGCNNT